MSRAGEFCVRVLLFLPWTLRPPDPDTLRLALTESVLQLRIEMRNDVFLDFVAPGSDMGHEEGNLSNSWKQEMTHCTGERDA